MKLFAATLVTILALATGFSCHKNTPSPPEPTTEMAPPAQDQMGAPADGMEPSPTPDNLGDPSKDETKTTR